MVKNGRRYRRATQSEVCESASAYAFKSVVGTVLRSPRASVDFLRAQAGLEYEQFGVIYLDNRHRVIRVAVLFNGTIDGASVHPRQVVKSVLTENAACVILFHNHPSGVAQPSNADEIITRRIKDALALIDVRVLDHVIIAGNDSLSMAERGLV
jgi:DNA repair protein RadC